MYYTAWRPAEPCSCKHPMSVPGVNYCGHCGLVLPPEKRCKEFHPDLKGRRDRMEKFVKMLKNAKA